MLELKICPTLKKLDRIVEKSLLKAEVEGDVSEVKDIVRLVRHVCIISEWHSSCHVRQIHPLAPCPLLAPLSPPSPLSHPSRPFVHPLAPLSPPCPL